MEVQTKMAAVAKHTIEIEIDDKEYEVRKTTMTGRELRELAQIPSGYRLFQEVKGEDKLISDEDAVRLKDEDEFYSLPVGQVGGPLQARLEREIAALQDEFPGLYLDEENGQQHVHLPGLPLASSTWNDTRVEIFLNLPPGFPAVAVPGFEADGQLRLRTGAQPAGSGFQPFHGRSWLHFCWNATNFDGSWRSLGQAIRFATRRFVEAA